MKTKFLKQVVLLMIPLLTMFNQVALAAAGDEVTSVSGITSGKWYYIKGVRSDGSTVEYLTFDDATNASASGTSASTTAGAIPLQFTYKSSKWYITTPNGYYITPAASNGCITVTSTETSVTLGDNNSLITILGASYYLQKNKTSKNFGGYNNTQNNVSLIEATTYTVSWSVNEGACSGSPTTQVVAGLSITALPTTPTSANCDNSKVFVGWSATAIDGSTNTEPSDLFSAVDEAPAITGNVTYYAVFAERSGSGTAKWKVTTTIKAGKTYVMGAVKASAASDLANNTTIGAITFATAYSSTDWGSYSNITPNSDGEIADASVTDAMKWRLKTISSGNHAFKKGANYLYLKSSGTGTNTCGVNSTANVYLESVSATCKDAFLLHPTSTNSGANKLLLNTGSNYGYRMYGSSTSASASMCPYIRFYVYDDGYTYTNYVTTCCEGLGAIDGDVTLTKTVRTMTATWPKTSGDHETGYSVQLYDNDGSGGKGEASGEPVAIPGKETANRTHTFTGLTPNHLYFVGVTPTYSGDGDYCEEGTEVTGNTTTNAGYTVTYASGTGATGTMTDSNSPYDAGATVTVLVQSSMCGALKMVRKQRWMYPAAVSPCHHRM